MRHNRIKDTAKTMGVQGLIKILQIIKTLKSKKLDKNLRLIFA